MNEKKKEEIRGAFDFLKDWGDALTRWTERWIPDALVIVIILSFVAYILALIWGFKPEVGLGSRAYQSVQAWGKGFWELLAFAMQMCLIMMTGYILACSPPVRRLMNGISGWSNPEKPWQAIVTMCALFNGCGMAQLGNQFDCQCHVSSLHCEEKSKSRLSSPHCRRLFRTRLHLALRLIRIIPPLGGDAG